MADIRSGTAWQELHRLFGSGTVSGLTEWQLLHRYVARRDEVAFAALVARHAPMVMGVCRRLLADPRDAEDAFQATFLVLVRKARALGPHDAIGHWLYGVAYRVALRARSEAARRRSRERVGVSAGDLESVADGGERAPDLDLRSVLDEELRRLSPAYRAAVVLCDLEGQTHAEAARQLGWPVGTVKGRLARARDLLRARLTRRGLTLTVAGLAARLAREAEASAPSVWVDATVKAAMKVAAGKATAAAVSAPVAVLVKGVLRAMILNQLKHSAVALAVLAAVAAGAGVMAQGDRSADAARDARPGYVAGAGTKTAATGRAAGSEPQERPAEAPERARGPRAEQATTRLFERALLDYASGRGDPEPVHLWSRRAAESAAAGGPARAAQDHLKRMRLLADAQKKRVESGKVPDDSMEGQVARYFVEEAERLAGAVGTEKTPAVSVRMSGATVKADKLNPDAGDGPGKDARSLAVLKVLDDPVSMNFPNETPIEDVLKYVRAGTRSAEFPNGLPIYVDPVGLQEAEKTLSSTVSIELEGVPLRRTLYLALRQLGLIYKIEDGMIYVTAANVENPGPLDPPFQSSTPPLLASMQEKAERGEMSAADRKQFIEMLKDLKQIKELIRGPVGASEGKAGGFQ